MKKAQGLPISTIIIAALGILVLVVLGAIFGGQIGTFGRAARECPGKCMILNPPAGSSADMQVGAQCNVNFESKLSGVWIAKGTPKGQETEHICNACCIPTG